MHLQELDTRLDQLAHARATSPEAERQVELSRRRDEVNRALALARTALADIQREVAKAEADVQLVRDRAARDQARLDSGTGTAKDLQALQHELASLARRQNDLEEIELEVMERAEAAETEVSALQRDQDDLDAQLVEATQARDAAYERLDAERDGVMAERGQVEPQVGAELLALYAKVRENTGGIAAAELRQRRCGGCRLELNAVDLGRFRAAADDDVLRCEECRRIVVRTPESGL